MRDSTANWQKILAQGFSSAVELLNYLNLPSALAGNQAERQFATRVPRAFAQRMEPGNPNDPLLKQVLALDEEMVQHEGFTADPLHEQTFNTRAGLIHKYHGRLLLTLVGACAINCRYCFRRHFPYQDNNPGRSGWDDVFTYIAADNTIHEVILSGGDPLLATDELLSYVLAGISAISHVKTLRIHSRIPVVLPERVDTGLINVLNNCRLEKVVVLHSNHPQELDERVKQACDSLRKINCHLLNQSVLLAGINDDAHILAGLSQRLFECGVLPYYLHLLDKVQGAAHFDTHYERAQKIFKTLQGLLPGYLVPRLTCEKPGEPSKTIMN